MSDTVMLQIGGLENEDILMTANIKIAFICNRPSELNDYIDNVRNTFEEGESVVAYVKTVNEPIDNTVLQYQNAKGMYYLFNWENNGWDPIVLGSHTHGNMEILDQLGDIDTDSLQINDTKILVLKKIGDPENRCSYSYKFEYIDLNEVPSLPETPSLVENGPLYLSVDKTGNYKWTNQLTPAQTFNYLTLIVDDTILNNDKQLTIPQDILDHNNFTFNSNNGDKLLIFDSGRLLTDINCEQNGSLTITIANTKDNETFDIGEQITIIVLRNGAISVLNELDSKYATKRELWEIVTEGNLELEGYPTISDMKTYAAPKYHTHNQYVTKPELDNGFLDWKYAPFYHQHSEYVTEAELYRFNKGILKTTTYKIGRFFQLRVNSISKIVININQSFSDGDIFELYVSKDPSLHDLNNIVVGTSEIDEKAILITNNDSYVYELNKLYDSSDVVYLYPYFNISPLSTGDGDIIIYYN